MKEQGIITKVVSGKVVEVAVKKNEACAKCGLCHEKEEGLMAIEAINEIGARREDMVEIEIPLQEVVKGSVVVFLLPVFFLVTGYLFGLSLTGREGWGILCSLVFLFFSFYVIRWYDKNVQQKGNLRAKIVRIVL